MVRGTSVFYKIRKGTVGNKSGDNFVITIPKFIASKYENVFFNISFSGDNIILESGCKHSFMEQNQTNKEYEQNLQHKKHLIGGTFVSFK